MNNTMLYFLLKTVKENQNLNSLLRAGLTYKNIGDFTELVASEHLIEITDKGIVLTENGQKKLDELKELNKKTNKNEWIEKEISSKIEKFPLDFIYLPHRNDLSF